MSTETPLAAATRRVPFSNGTEGYGWMDKWCAYCVHDHEVHAGGGPGCGIICSALLAGGGNEWCWPEAWLPEPDDGTYAVVPRVICGQFEPCTHGGCTGDPGADARAERVAEVTVYWRDRRVSR